MVAFWVCIASICITWSNCSKWSGNNANSHFWVCPCVSLCVGVGWVGGSPSTCWSCLSLHSYWYWLYKSNEGLSPRGHTAPHRLYKMTFHVQTQTKVRYFSSDDWALRKRLCLFSRSSSSSRSEYTFIISFCDHAFCWQVNQSCSTETQLFMLSWWMEVKWMASSFVYYKVEQCVTYLLHGQDEVLTSINTFHWKFSRVWNYDIKFIQVFGQVTFIFAIFFRRHISCKGNVSPLKKVILTKRCNRHLEKRNFR